MDCLGSQGKSREDWNQRYKYFRWRWCSTHLSHLYSPTMMKLKACSYLNFSFLPVVMCPSVRRSRRYMEMQGAEGHPEVLSFKFLPGFLFLSWPQPPERFLGFKMGHKFRSWCLWDCPNRPSFSKASLDFKGY